MVIAHTHSCYICKMIRNLAPISEISLASVTAAIGASKIDIPTGNTAASTVVMSRKSISPIGLRTTEIVRDSMMSFLAVQIMDEFEPLDHQRERERMMEEQRVR